MEAKYLSGVERGTRNPTIDVRTRSAGGLGVEVATLFDTYEVEDAGALRRELRARLKGMSEEHLRRALRVIDATTT